MYNFVAFTLLMAGISQDPAAFNYARYEESTIEAVIKRADAFDSHESGQSVLTPPLPFHLRAAVESYPTICPDELPHLLMRTVGIPNPPPMGWCMKVKGESGAVVNLWVQDSFAQFITEEYDLGQDIELWALWLFVNDSDRKPYFVVNGIGPAEEKAAGSDGGT